MAKVYLYFIPTQDNCMYPAHMDKNVHGVIKSSHSLELLTP